MISEKDKKGMEKWLLESENPKTKQKIELLKNNQKFLSDIDILKDKWNDLLKKHIILINNVEKTFSAIMERAYSKKEVPPKISKDELKNLSSWGKIFNGELFTNTKFSKDIFNLCEKYKLYPIDTWQYSLLFFILMNDFEQPNIWAGLNLLPILSPKELLQLPKNMNFDIEIRDNEKTKEQELFIHIFESTSWRDLKEHWKIINDLQKQLKKEKGIGKRYYPRKNLKIEKKLTELDKLKDKKYYEPTLDKWVNEKITDQKKALEIYDDNLMEEGKAKNRIKQIRHRYKKM